MYNTKTYQQLQTTYAPELKSWEKPYINADEGVDESKSPQAFQCFIKYRDMGVNRSLKKLATQTGIDYGKIKIWSYRYKWNQRITEMVQDSAKRVAPKHQEAITLELENDITQGLLIKQLLNNELGASAEQNFKEMGLEELERYQRVISGLIRDRRNYMDHETNRDKFINKDENDNDTHVSPAFQEFLDVTHDLFNDPKKDDDKEVR